MFFLSLIVYFTSEPLLSESSVIITAWQRKATQSVLKHSFLWLYEKRLNIFLSNINQCLLRQHGLWFCLSLTQSGCFRRTPQFLSPPSFPTSSCVLRPGRFAAERQTVWWKHAEVKTKWRTDKSLIPDWLVRKCTFKRLWWSYFMLSEYYYLCFWHSTTILTKIIIFIDSEV